MKFNKKLVVTSLSTVLGLGIVGSITGTVAWYQYSTRASASIIGTSAGSSGMLRIKEHSQAETAYTKNVYTASLKGSNTDAKLYPVTFGGMASNAALPAKAYNNPEAGIKEVNRSDNEAGADKEYIQFSVDLITVDGTGAQVGGKKVYISQLVLEDASTSGTPVTSALRMHISAGSKNVLVAPTAKTTNCYGKLDLDNDGALDNDKDFEWQTGNEITYGHYDDSDPAELIDGEDGQQVAVAPTSIVHTRSSDGTFEDNDDKLIGTTSATEALTVTVTIWLEGWDLMGSTTAIWAASTMGRTVHAGLTFDVGSHAFDA